ncbi:hypothetical protein JCM19000A_42560 [Silvimonas sp. JCM 19000]
MKQKTLLEVLAEDQGSVEAVLGVIAELCGELRQGQVEDWENTTLLQFLDLSMSVHRFSKRMTSTDE